MLETKDDVAKGEPQDDKTGTRSGSNRVEEITHKFGEAKLENGTEKDGNDQDERSESVV